MTELWEPVGGIFWSTAPLLPHLNLSTEHVALLTSIVGALAGAGIGAWAAGHISEKNKTRDQLTKEIRDTNAAIMLALGVMNAGIGLKRQHIKPLKESYDEQREKVKRIIAEMAKGQQQIDFPQINLIQLPEIAPPVIYLQEIVLSRLSTAGRALASVTQLTDAVSNLNVMLKQRNELIRKMKNGEFPVGAKKEHLCFGLRYGNGETNEEYHDSVQGISSYTDDIIFFGSELCLDLLEHADLLVGRFKKRLRGPVPEINKIDLSKARLDGWIPDGEGYKNWTSGFRTTRKAQRKRWLFFWRKCNP
ncbi:hypothetical protein [Pseudomonas brassicacearum]|uniref:hypothetical protein n=1 Tax=Pseudomonas brassicacearum TaxID=930166 RepID=UPI0027373F39|nr:hypothetical protein [Pseudomonas brassicacearum]WLG70030.1 hypothetical protein PSH71_09565 [Pseudomonas brassicacearum]